MDNEVEMFTEEEREFLVKILTQVNGSLADPSTIKNSMMVISILQKLKSGDK